MSGEESFVIVNHEMSIKNDLQSSTDMTTTDMVCEMSTDLRTKSKDDTETKPNDSTSTNGIVEVNDNHQADSTIKNDEHPVLLGFDTLTTRGKTSTSTNSLIDKYKFDFLRPISMGCPEDEVKLQNLLSEHADLKKTLHKTNLTMKRLYDNTRKWKLNLLDMEEKAKLEIAKLYNENHELRRQLDVPNRMEPITTNDETIHENPDECIQCVSDNYSQIENYRPQVQDFEHKYLSPTVPTECVPILEHQRIIRQLENKISTITDKNIELNNMQKNTKADLKLLQSIAEKRSEKLTEVEKQLKESSTEIDMLRNEISIYINDFKAEKDARANLAKEKDQLLMDLRELLRKNQELVEGSQKIDKKHSTQLVATGTYPQTSNILRIGISSTTAPRHSIQNNIPKPGNYKCPLCGNTYDNLDVLQIHVNKCLDET